MNRTLLALAVMVAALGATAARADDCGPRPTSAPQSRGWNDGSYQLQTTQVWVPGEQQQVWVPPGPECRQYRFRHCTGSYRWVSTAGQYETQQQWVWVTNTRDRRPSREYGRNWRGGQHHEARPVGYY